MIPAKTRRFLLRDSDPSIRLLALKDLWDRPENDPEVRAARRQIGRKGWAAEILRLQNPGGHWEVLRKDESDLYVPKYISTNFRLIVLADLELTRRDPRIDRAAKLLLDRWSHPKEGIWGEPGSETCITGNAVRMMVRFGFGEDPRVQRALDWLVSAQKADGGWHCWRSRTGTLAAWEAMAAFAALPPSSRSPRLTRAIERGAEFYLERGLLREADGSTYGPWRRIHYPHHYYYDFLLGLDFLTALGYGSDRRLRPALDLLERKRGKDGAWRLDAVQPDLEASDPYHHPPPIYPVMLEYLGEPSQWATLVALRVLRRAGRL
jgi:hypothetical protein